MSDKWDGMSVQFRMHDAAIVAILIDNAAVTARGLDLIIQDGRFPHWHGPDEEHDNPRCQLDYKCFVAIEGAPGESVQSREGMIHIDGYHENGERLVIRGPGWVGRDEDDSIDVVFDLPPVMLFYDSDEEDEVDNSSDADACEANIVSIRPQRKRQDDPLALLNVSTFVH